MENIERIFEYLRSGTPEERESAARQLREMQAEELTRTPIDALMGALDDPDASIRIAAARALASKGDPAGVPRLVLALSDPYPGVRRQIERALADIGAAADQTVLGLLDDPDPLLRGGAIRVIGTRGLRTALPRVIEALGDPSEDVRRGAAEALASIGDESEIPRLIDSLLDNSSSVQWNAKDALMALGIPAVRALSDALDAGSPRVRLAVIDVLRAFTWGDAKKGPEILSGLVRGLRDELTEVRRTAARGLGQLQDPGATPYQLAGLDDPDASVRGDVLSALGACGDASALPRLLVAWSDPDLHLQQEASRALCHIGDETILPEVLGPSTIPTSPGEFKLWRFWPRSRASVG